MGRHITFPTFPGSCHLDITKASPYMLTGGSAGRIDRMANFLDHPKEVEYVSGDRKHTVIYGTYLGLPVMAFSTGMGPSSVSIILPEAFEASDDPNIVILRLGTCGGIRSFLNVGDLVISKDMIYRRESVSDYIMGPGYIAVPDKDIAETLEVAANEHIQSFQTVYAGKTTTVAELYFTNEFYRNMLAKPDTRAKLYSEEDSLAISMEGSVYCALRDKYNYRWNYNIKMGEIFTVSDIVAPKDMAESDRELFAKNLVKIEEAQILTGLETLYRMSNA